MIEAKTQIIARSEQGFHSAIKISAQMLGMTVSDLVELGIENFVTSPTEMQGILLPQASRLRGSVQLVARVDDEAKRNAQHTAIDLGCSLQDIVLAGTWGYVGSCAEEIKSKITTVHQYISTPA